MTAMVPRGELADLSRLRSSLRDTGIDCLIASSSRNVYYLSGYRPFDSLIEPESSAFAVVSASEDTRPCVVVSMSERYVFEDFPSAIERRLYFGTFHVVNGPPVEPVYPAAYDALVDVLRTEYPATARIAFESALLPGWVSERLALDLPSAEFVGADGVLRDARAVKTPDEIERIRRATHALDESIDVASALVQPGMSEAELAKAIYVELAEREAEPVYCLIGSGRRSALGIPYPTTKAMEAGEVVRVDIAAAYGQYHTDLGRSFVVGPSTPRQREAYRVAREALDVAIDAAVAGAETDAVVHAAMASVEASGHTELKRHHVGHGVGLQAHEWPFLRAGGGVIAAGSVLALEVPYYIYDMGGFAPEDVVVVHDGWIERLSTSPVELPSVGSP